MKGVSQPQPAGARGADSSGGEGYACETMRRATLAALVLAACGDMSPSGFSTGPGVTTAPASTGASSTGGGSTTTGTADDSQGPGSAEGMSTDVLRDVGTDEDFGPTQPVGCKGKVDVLFLISSLFTMETEQKQLLASFPGFVATVQEKLGDFDIHLMVANPTGEWAGWPCEKGCNDDPKTCAEDGYQCNVYPKLITSCDYTLGAGLIFNAGGDAANRQCELFGGHRYIVSGEPDLADAIECIAKVGVSGGEPPMGDALIAALAPKINAEGGCNAGFLRDDALLVVAFIIDSEDISSTSWPYQQYQAVVDAKGGDPNAIVALGVIAQPIKDPPVPGCAYNDIGDQYKMLQLLKKFPYHVEGDTCAPSYAPFFDQAADLIGEACGKFVPQ